MHLLDIFYAKLFSPAAIKDDIGPGGSLKSRQICGDITVQLSGRSGKKNTRKSEDYKVGMSEQVFEKKSGSVEVIWVFPNIGVGPQNGWFINYVWKHPYVIYFPSLITWNNYG